jgi:hypothetical protein
MIVVGCTEEDEAIDMADILRTHLPADWDYQILCQGREFTTRNENSGRQRRAVVDELLAGAGPAGITVRSMRTQLNRAGFRTAQATLYRWLNEYREQGRVTHDGQKWALARREVTR